MFVQGGVYRFSYLWHREHITGEESGRKSRPACIVFKTRAGKLFIVAITTREPLAGQDHLAVPPSELAAAGLMSRSWIILDEFNSAFENHAYDFDSLDPIGRFSEPFLRTVQERLLALVRSGRARAVHRS